MNPVYFCDNGCSSVAFCVSPKGEKELFGYLNSVHAKVHANNFSELCQWLYGPFSDGDTEMHEKAGSILRIWSRCKWTEHHDVARFIHSLTERILSPDDYLFIRIGSENMEDTVQDGDFFNNPFGIWVQRRIVFKDDADQPRTTTAELKERESYRKSFAQGKAPMSEHALDPTGRYFEEKTPLQLTVRKYVDVSTAHITENDNRLLAGVCFSTSPGIVVYEKAEHGYWVHVPHDDVEECEQRLVEYGYSAAFLALLQEARKAGVCWICLDGDGAVSDKLSTFNW